MQPLKDASHLYEVERRVRHAERPGFRINELRIRRRSRCPGTTTATSVTRSMSSTDGSRTFLREPNEEVQPGPGDTFTVDPRRPHLVTNGGDCSATFLTLQGVGEMTSSPCRQHLPGRGVVVRQLLPNPALQLTAKLPPFGRSRARS